MKGATREETLAKYGKKKLCNDCSFLGQPPPFPERKRYEADVLCQRFKGHVENGKLKVNKMHCWKGIVEGQFISVRWEPNVPALTDKEKSLMEKGVEVPSTILKTET